MRCSYVTRWIPVVLLLSVSLLAHGQMTATLTGYVTDAHSGSPMPFANVYVNGSTRGAVTDEKGYYVLAGLPVGTAEIAVSFVGYQPAKRTIRFADAAPQRINFQLKASEQALDAVTVRGNSKSRERNLRLFKKLLFGEPFGDQCQLVNSDVLAFNEAGDHLYATATEPLVIDNQALGYRLIYALQQFDATTSGGVYYAGATRFEALKPENERQANRFRRNRLTAYRGSIRHLMASLCTNSFEQDGFLVYQEDATRSIPLEQRSMTLAAAVNEYKRLVPVKSSGLIQAGRLATERRLVSPLKLIIFYTNAVSGLSPYPDARYAYTEMKLPSGQLQLTVDGVITAAEGMEAKGSMGNDRLSTMLPADWKPDGTENEFGRSGPLTAQGKLLPPDTSLGRITAAFNERFKWLAPTVYVHIDKPVYVTGDRLWLSTYVLDAASHQRLDDETALHLDLLTPAGKRVQHQWVRIVDGRGEGNFRLADTLVTGTYRLRAYTDGDAAQRRPAFERSVPIYNLLRSNKSKPVDSVAQPLDVQLLPEGGRWLAGLPARLGVKVVQATGQGLSITGRIVDDVGVDVARFKTNPQGMTSVSLEPGAQRTYYAEVVYTNQPQRVPLPKPELEGLVLSVDALSDTTRLALTIRSTKQADSAYVLIQQRGQVIDQRKVLLQNGVANVSLPMLTWLPGLTQITLYDAAAKPQAERLVFVPEFVAPIRVVVGLNKSLYQPREPVILSMHLTAGGSPVAAALSASITDATNVPADTAEATLPTHLLLTGELRGRIENPNQYVTNRSPETRKALDDLLLTQGWRRVSGTSETDRLGGVSLVGRIVNDKQQPIPGTQLVVTSTAPRQSFVRSAGADGQGHVRLAELTIIDTVRLLTRITDQRFKPLSTKAAFLIQEELGRGWEADKRTGVQAGYLARLQLAAALARQEANADFYRDKTAKVLESVTVRAQKFDKRPDDIQQRSLHNEADAVIVVDEKSPVYQNLYEMIQGRLTGVTVTREGAAQARSYKVFVRGVSSFKIGMQPLYLLDGVPIQDTEGTALLTINASDIERIELLKSGGAAGIYGVRGGNGVIAFYTRSARSMQGSTKPNEGLTAIQLIGYPSIQRDFYVPRYDTEVADSTRSGPADLRDVLYWKPTIQTDSKGYSQLRFPLSDAVRMVRIVVQGVAADGRPVLGVQLVQVR